MSTPENSLPDGRRSICMVMRGKEQLLYALHRTRLPIVHSHQQIFNGRHISAVKSSLAELKSEPESGANGTYIHVLCTLYALNIYTYILVYIIYSSTIDD